MRGPGGFSGGRVCDAQISQIDLFPTICDLLQVPPPSWLQGKSLLPLVSNQTEEIHEAVFTEATYHAAYEPQRAVRTPRWKYIRHFGTRQIPVLTNCDDSLSKDVWLQYGWGTQLVAPEQLYDLIFDPNEACNRIDDPAYATVLQEMRQRLDDWMQETGDPLLQGSVAPPSGVELNDPDQVSPAEPTYFV